MLKVTIDLKQYIMNVGIFYRNNSNKFLDKSNYDTYLSIYVSYNGFVKGYFLKCFALELNQNNKKDVQFFLVWMKSTIFDIYPGGYRPSDGSFTTLIHYPNQFISSWHALKIGWPEIRRKGNYTMVYLIKQMEYLKRRDKINHPCSTDSSFDSDLIGNVSKEANCRAPYVTHLQNVDALPFCTGKAAIQQAMIGNSNMRLNNIISPCEILVSVDYDYSDKYHNHETNQYFENKPIPKSSIGIWLRFPERFKVITHRKEICFHALVGNCGGYIGLFLGNYILITE